MDPARAGASGYSGAHHVRLGNSYAGTFVRLLAAARTTCPSSTEPPAESCEDLPATIEAPDNHQAQPQSQKDT
jgi:hypothetical protein